MENIPNGNKNTETELSLNRISAFMQNHPTIKGWALSSLLAGALGANNAETNEVADLPISDYQSDFNQTQMNHPAASRRGITGWAWPE